MRHLGRWLPIAASCCTLLGAAAATPARAQGHPLDAGPLDRAVQFRLGGFFPKAEGGLWEENESVFTLDGSDFNGVAAGFSYVHGATNHVELGLNIDFYGETVLAADRDFTEAGTGAPILHDTDLGLVPLTVDLRFLPAGRYRIRGERRVLKPVFYVGGGLGFTFWEYEETGDFVDDSDPLFPEIFFDRYKDSGAAFEVHALAGAEIPITPHFHVLLEGRRSWSEAEPDESYAEFFLNPGGDNDLDLDATWVQAGVSYRF
jgi:hypothetical protein